MEVIDKMTTNNEVRNTRDIVVNQEIYPRFKTNPAKIQEYAENIELLPPIEISQNNILIDGYHRLKAFETEKRETIPVVITEVANQAELEQLTVKRNSTYGMQLTRDEKIKCAQKWWGNLSDDIIIATLSISERTLSRWTTDKREDSERRQNQEIFDLWLSCLTEQEIADIVGLDIATISRKIAIFLQNSQLAEINNFSNFTPQKYAMWNFGKATNRAKIFGNIPPEIIDNLLYYFTNPFDVVFDPFGGGGSTIDKCIERNRRYFVSDLTPIPARPDICQWDMTQGLPPNLPVPDLVFLDPPYWRQAKGKYSDKPQDLSNMPLDRFVSTIASIAQETKRKWSGNRPNGKLALIIGQFQEDWQYTDLPFLCYQAVIKYLKPVVRIQVPYSTDVHKGNFVNMAKEGKHILYLSRDLMVFGI